jgi:hypothetical protein
MRRAFRMHRENCTVTRTWHLFCADCGKGMHRSPSSRPQGQARCQDCRRSSRQEPKPKRIVGTGKSWRDCEVCDQRYRAKQKEQRTCGRRCGAQINSRIIQAAPKSCAVHWSSCLVCGTWITQLGKVTCAGGVCRIQHSLAKQRAAYVPTARPTTVPCEDCGRPHTTPTAFNCGVCKRCQKRRKRRLYGENHRQRARHFGVRYEHVDAQRVFERDRWCCQLCGRKVNRAVKYPHPDYPSLDHVIPMSRGGDHGYANVQCAHFLCNSTKGVGGSQQLALIG